MSTKFLLGLKKKNKNFLKFILCRVLLSDVLQRHYKEIERFSFSILLFNEIIKPIWDAIKVGSKTIAPRRIAPRTIAPEKNHPLDSCPPQIVSPEENCPRPPDNCPRGKLTPGKLSPHHEVSLKNNCLLSSKYPQRVLQVN